MNLPTPILVDARNWDSVQGEILDRVARSTFIGFDIETEDSKRHDGLNQFMKIDDEGFKGAGKPLVFDVNRTEITGFSIWPEGSGSAYYVNLRHADVENRLPWSEARRILDAKCDDAFWICHNAPFELTMMRMSLGFSLGRNTICTLQFAVSTYNEDQYPLDRFHSAPLPGHQLLPRICREFQNMSQDGELTPEQGELLAQVIAKESKSAWSYNGWVKEISYGYGLKQAVKSWFGYEMTTFEEVLGGVAHMGLITGEQVVAYGCDDAYWAVRLFRKLLEHNARFQPKVNEVFFSQENPMIHVYSACWGTGMKINREAVERQRELERRNYAELVRRIKANLNRLLPFDEAPSEQMTKLEPWYAKNWHTYRQRLIALADAPDSDDPFVMSCQIAGAVPNAWAEELGQTKPTSVNLNHYMAQRTLFYDLCRMKPVVSKGKVQSDKDTRDKLIKRAEKDENALVAETIKLIGEMASVDTRMKLYLTPYRLLIDPDTGRIYPVISSQLNSRRMASQFPNPMQLAKRGESTYIRGFYEPDEEDHVIVSIDWSQIELVEIGDFSGDPGFAEAYAKKPYKDLHWKAVADMFELTVEEVKARPDGKSLRTKVGKGSNFNYWYSGALSTVGDVMGWSSDKMWEMTEKYRQTFPVAEEWRVSTINQAREKGFVELPDGHRRYKFEATYEWQQYMRARFEAIGNDGASNFGDLMIRRLTSRAGNQIVNSLIQGSCATLAKRSIVRIDEWIAQERLRARFMIPIHDELVWSVHRNEVVPFITGAKRIMCHHPDIITKLMIDATASVGRTFEPYHPEKAPFGQIELDEAPVIEGWIPAELKDSRLDDEHIQKVVDYLFSAELTG